MMIEVNTELYYRVSGNLVAQGVPGYAIMHMYDFNMSIDRLRRAATVMLRNGNVIIAWKDKRPVYILKPLNFKTLYNGERSH